MVWAKVDDGWWCHPKVVALSPAARGLWVSALSWSCQQRRPTVPTAMVSLLAPGHDVTDEADELVEAGLWDEVDGGWLIHDWQEYQQPTVSEARADAGRRGGLASGQTRNRRSKTKQDGTNREPTGKQDEATPKQTVKQESLPGPVPSRPDPETPLATRVASKTRPKPNYSPEFEAFWDAYPRHPANGKPGGGGTKAEAWAEWLRLDDDDRAAATAACGPHAAALRKADAPPKHACRFLKHREFDGYAEDLPPPVCAHCRGPADERHDDLYCQELRDGKQVRHA